MERRRLENWEFCLAVQEVPQYRERCNYIKHVLLATGADSATGGQGLPSEGELYSNNHFVNFFVSAIHIFLSSYN